MLFNTIFSSTTQEITLPAYTIQNYGIL